MNIQQRLGYMDGGWGVGLIYVATEKPSFLLDKSFPVAGRRTQTPSELTDSPEGVWQNCASVCHWNLKRERYVVYVSPWERILATCAYA